MSAISATSSANQISPASERVYHQSNLLGDWKGTWTQNHQPVEFKVLSIRGSTAQVEYTHNGHTERGTGTVNGASINFNNVTVATRNGQKAVIEFDYGTARMTGVLDKSAATQDQNKLIGTWIGSTDTMSASFKVVSITGRDAQVQYTINGKTGKGTGDLTGNTVMLGKVQVTSSDGVHGTVVFPNGHRTISLAVTKFTPNTKSTGSTVNKLA
jgi:hypothetical protein